MAHPCSLVRGFHQPHQDRRGLHVHHETCICIAMIASAHQSPLSHLKPCNMPQYHIPIGHNSHTWTLCNITRRRYWPGSDHFQGNPYHARDPQAEMMEKAVAELGKAWMSANSLTWCLKHKLRRCCSSCRMLSHPALTGHAAWADTSCITIYKTWHLPLFLCLNYLPKRTIRYHKHTIKFKNFNQHGDSRDRTDGSSPSSKGGIYQSLRRDPSRS